MAVTHKMATKRKHQEVTLKVKYALEELEKGRQNKDVANHYATPGTWYLEEKQRKDI